MDLADTTLPFLVSPPTRTSVLNIGQDYLEKYMIHQAANSNSPEENAKLSLLVEYFVLALIRENKIQWTSDLQELAERGVQARSEKAIGLGRRKASSSLLGDARNELLSSGTRILMCLDLLRSEFALYPAITYNSLTTLADKSPDRQIRDTSSLSILSNMTEP